LSLLLRILRRLHLDVVVDQVMPAVRIRTFLHQFLSTLVPVL
jgi:hypothetical protein